MLLFVERCLSMYGFQSDWLLSYGWLWFTKASILHGSGLICQMVVLVAVTTGLAVVMCPDDPEELTLAGTRHCLSLPTDWTSLTITSVASFIIGVFVRKVLDRWWETRLQVQSFGGRIKSICMFLCAWTATSDVAVVEQRQRAVRLLNFAHSLFFLTSKQKTTVEDMEHLIESGICTKEEASAVAGLPECYSIVLSWVASIANDLQVRHGAITELHLYMINDMLQQIRSSGGNALLYVNTQLPFGAVQLITMMVYAFEVQLIAVCSGVVGMGLQTSQHDHVFMGYFTAIFASQIYLGLLSLYGVLCNPFGDDPDDFPTAAYQDNLLRVTAGMEKASPPAVASGMLNVISSRNRHAQTLPAEAPTTCAASSDGLSEAPTVTQIDSDATSASTILAFPAVCAFASIGESPTLPDTKAAEAARRRQRDVSRRGRERKQGSFTTVRVELEEAADGAAAPNGGGPGGAAIADTVLAVIDTQDYVSRGQSGRTWTRSQSAGSARRPRFRPRPNDPSPEAVRGDRGAAPDWKPAEPTSPRKAAPNGNIPSAGITQASYSVGSGYNVGGNGRGADQLQELRSSRLSPKRSPQWQADGPVGQTDLV